ncbi:hypothetical protein C4D60_Mb02t23310 [Musa balbisiana]|uniref:Uncharacterized protein n=1 Tax=Musa balbisiana TaxID=52838 RepID=A0A4S8ICU5_MUSBA|nr:hypothetical protein C4D60_Mb02t23310 [Musa balbisiana]
MLPSICAVAATAVVSPWRRCPNRTITAGCHHRNLNPAARRSLLGPAVAATSTHDNDGKNGSSYPHCG